MIAAAAWWQLRADGPTPLDDGADPNLPASADPPTRAAVDYGSACRSVARLVP